MTPNSPALYTFRLSQRRNVALCRRRSSGRLAGVGSLGLLGILLRVVRHVVSPTAVAARVAPRGAVQVRCREMELTCPFSVKDVLQRKCAFPRPLDVVAAALVCSPHACSAYSNIHVNSREEKHTSKTSISCEQSHRLRTTGLTRLRESL